MNNNLVKFIEEKMKGLQKRIDTLKCEIDILDTALYSSLLMSSLSEREKFRMNIEFTNKQAEIEYVKKQYKNLNIIRMTLLGLI